MLFTTFMPLDACNDIKTGVIERLVMFQHAMDSME